MGFVQAIAKNDLQTGQMKGVEIVGREVLLVNINDDFFAIGNRCTHMACMLSDGRLEGENVICVCHGSVFSVRTGNVIKGPAKTPEPVYQIKIEGNQILVSV